MSKKNIKVKIVELKMIRALDENGKYHDIDGYPHNTAKETVLYDDVDGELSSEWKQDRYTDGSYSRNESLHTVFKITDKLN